MAEITKTSNVVHDTRLEQGDTTDSKSLRTYSPPKVISSELLEATAIACGDAGALGKNPFPTCQAPSS